MENHARNEMTRRIHCPCKACKNLRAFNEPTIIRSHVLVGGFVKDYMLSMYHDETSTSSPLINPLDEIILDELFDRMFDAYDDFDDGGGDDDSGGGFHGDDVDDGPINSGSSDDELNMVIF